MREVFFYDPRSMETTPMHWDCECIDNYIHFKNEKSCEYCGAIKEDQPDSRVSEVYAMHYKMIDLIHRKKHE